MKPYVTTPAALDALNRRFDDAFRITFKPRPIIPGSEWANQHYILPAAASSEPGPYSWERIPYQKEIIDVLCDQSTQKIVLQMAARSGKSTCMAIATGYFMHQDPSNLLWLHPTLGLAEQFSETTIDPLTKNVAVIRELVKDKRQRDSGNTKLVKRFGAHSLFMVGAESPSGLRAKTVRVILADEIDAYPASAGNEGSPLALVANRQSTYGSRKKLALASTPTFKHASEIEAQFLLSDQRYYFVPCPHCGHSQKLEWKNLHYKTNPLAPTYECIECERDIEEHHKFSMLHGGGWRATAKSDVVGFHLNALYSPLITWRELADEWRDAQKSIGRLQSFMNTKLAETWTDVSDTVTVSFLQQRLEDYSAECPTKTTDANGIAVITCGVDVQMNRIEAGVFGYSSDGTNEEHWLLDYRVIEGDVTDPNTLARLTQFLFNARYRTPSGHLEPIRSVAIDIGYASHTVGQYVAQLKRAASNVPREFIAVKGSDNDRFIISQQAKHHNAHNYFYYNLGGHAIKNHLASIMANPTRGANFLHLPRFIPGIDGQEPQPLDNSVLDMLTAEKPKSEPDKKTGKHKRVWKQIRDRNEAWDTYCYSFAALIRVVPHIHHTLPPLADQLAKKEGTSTPSSNTSTGLSNVSAPAATMKNRPRYIPAKNRITSRW